MTASQIAAASAVDGRIRQWTTDAEKGGPGQIIEATYSVTDNVLRTYDDEGRLLGTDKLQPGDDAAHAARRILKEKHDRHGSFHDPIHYRGHIV